MTRHKTLNLVVYGLSMVVAAALFICLLPHKVTVPNDAGFTDLVIEHRFVVAALRVGLLYLAIYLAVSVTVLLRDGRFITGAGPWATSRVRTETRETVASNSQALRRYEQLVSDSRTQLRANEVTITSLRRELSELTERATGRAQEIAELRRALEARKKSETGG